MLAQEQPVANRLGEQERSDDGPDVKEGEKDRQPFAGPDVQEPADPRSMDRRSLLQVPHRLGCHPCPSADSFSLRRRPEGGGAQRAADVRLLLPGDGGLQHDPAAHALEGDSEPGSGERPVGHPRLRPDHRRADGGLHAAGERAAPPVGAADHAGTDGRGDGRLLGSSSARGPAGSRSCSTSGARCSASC